MNHHAHALADLSAWIREDHEPITLHFDRATLFAIASTLQHSIDQVSFPSPLKTRLENALVSLRDLMPADIADLSTSLASALEVELPPNNDS